jgi:hypothetical protein
MCFSVSVVLSDARRRPGYPDALKKLADTNSVAHAVMTRSRTSSRSSTPTQRKLESLVENHSALDAVPNGKSIPLSFISPLRSFIMQDLDGNLQLVHIEFSRQYVLVRLTVFRSLPWQGTFVLRVTMNISFIRLLAPRHRPVYQVYANVRWPVWRIPCSVREHSFVIIL